MIFVVVDCLTKYGHFMTLSHPHTVKEVTQEFIKGVFKLHGFSRSVVSHRDPIFLRSFWENMFELQYTTLTSIWPIIHKQIVKLKP